MKYIFISIAWFSLVFFSSMWALQKLAVYIDANQYDVFTYGIMPPEIIPLADIHGFVKYCNSHGSKVALSYNNPTCYINNQIVSFGDYYYYVK